MVATAENPYDIFSNTGNHALFHKIRAEDPIHCAIGPKSGNRFWFIMRYDDCAALIKDQRIGKDRTKHLPPELNAQWGNPSEAYTMVNNHMLNLDPPDHTRLRTLVHKAFTPTMIRKNAAKIHQMCDDLLDDMEGHDTLDLMSTYADVIPVKVISEMLGVPTEDHAKFRDWTKQIIFDDYEKASVSIMEFIMYIHEQVDMRLEEPQDDLLTGLAYAEEAGDTLTRQELLSMVFLLLAAGHETTTNLIGNGMVALLTNPDQLDDLKQNIDDDSLHKTMVEEILRFNGPATSTLLRFAFDDVEIRGKTILKGDGVSINLHSANRDPEVFPEPDKFDIRRTPNNHLDFGGGIHYCLGAPLARIEGAIAIPALVKRFPDIQLAVPADELEMESRAFHGFKEVPVTLE